jgi:hypothetical protein
MILLYAGRFRIGCRERLWMTNACGQGIRGIADFRQACRMNRDDLLEPAFLRRVGPGRHAKSRPWARLPPPRTFLGVLSLIGAAVMAWVWWAMPDGAPALAGPAPAASAPHSIHSGPLWWATVLDQLDRRRAEAFAQGDLAALDTVYAPGSPALGRDRERLRELLAANARARGLRLQITRAEAAALGPDRVVLRVVDRLAPHVLVDPSGNELERRPGRGPAEWQVTMLRAGSGWRVYDVMRA